MPRGGGAGNSSAPQQIRPLVPARPDLAKSPNPGAGGMTIRRPRIPNGATWLITIALLNTSHVTRMTVDLIGVTDYKYGTSC